MCLLIKILSLEQLNLHLLLKLCFLKMKNLLASTRSKYLLALGVFAIGAGVVSKKVISYPTECSPMKNQEITYLFKI